MSEFVDMSSMIKFDSCVKLIKPKKKVNKRQIKKPQIDSLYIRNSKPVLFDNKTMQYYRVARARKLDPILNEEVSEQIAFKFGQQWDPYTGERFMDDPYGPLYFHPASLIYYFYVHRLTGLWKNEEDTPTGVLEGYYDMFAGAGDEMEVIGRGKFVERYLFRLPILDCYLTTDHSETLITMGPKLTNQEIETLERLSCNQEVQRYYINLFGKQCPNIVTMKKLYDCAIKKPSYGSNQMTIEKYQKDNRNAIDKLKAM